MSTHIEITNRAEYFLAPSKAKTWLEVKDFPDYKAYLQAGAFFPDWGYACANQHDSSEAAHWPPFFNETVKYIRETYPERPWNKDALRLVSFLMGIVSHGVADVPWHSLDTDQGFIHVSYRKLGKIDEFVKHSCFRLWTKPSRPRKLSTFLY
jgi:glycosylphosphatidylinositol phospholipase D